MKSLDAVNVAFVEMKYLSLSLDVITELRPILRLRSSVAALSRLLSPIDAPTVQHSVFHLGYSICTGSVVAA